MSCAIQNPFDGDDARVEDRHRLQQPRRNNCRPATAQHPRLCICPANAAANTNRQCRSCRTLIPPARRLRQTKRRPRGSRHRTRDVRPSEMFSIGNAEFFRDGHHQQFARAFGRLNRGVAGHQRHAARIAAEINRRQIGIGGDHANVERIDPQNFGDDVGQNRIQSPGRYRSSHTSRRRRPGDRAAAARPTAACCSSRSANPRRRCTNCTRCRFLCRTAACDVWSQAENLFFQSEPATTLSMHWPRPMLPMRR